MVTATPFSIRCGTQNWRAFFTSILVAASATLASLAGDAEAIEDESLDPAIGITVRSMLESAGTPAKKAAEFVVALEKALQKQALEPLNRWLLDADERIQIYAGIMMISISPEKAEPKLIKAIESRKEPRDPLVIALGMSERKETIDFLVQRVTATKNDAEEPALVALQVRTGRAFKEGWEWDNWWKTERARFKRPPVADPFEFIQRLQAVHADKALGKLDVVLKGTAAESIGNLFQHLSRGRELEFSEETLRGVAEFCRGELDSALASYGKAIEVDQFDLVALIDSACLFLEASRYEDAARSFQRLEALIPNSPLLGDLRKLADQRVPSSKWLGILEAAFRSDGKKYEIMSEPLLAFLFSRSASSAKLTISPAFIEKILTNPESSFEHQLGAALVGSRAAIQSWMALIRTRFPESPTAHAWYFLTTVEEKELAEESARACAKWSELELTNAVPRVGAVALKMPKTDGNQLLPALHGELLEELAQALSAPDTDFHLNQAAAARRAIIAETGFPLPGLVQNPDELLADYVMRIGRGMTFNRTNLVITPEQRETYVRIRDVFAKTSDRFSPDKFRGGMTKAMSLAMMIFAAETEKALLEKEAGNEAAIAAIKLKLKAMNDRVLEEGPVARVAFRLLPLPSLHQAIEKDENR